MNAANSQSKHNSAASDIDSLKALILAQRSEIENLHLLVQKLRRMHFGPRSEKLQPDIDQLELRLEDLEMNAASIAPAIAVTVAAAGHAARKPARRPLPAELPREVETIAPAQEKCPDCGGQLRPFGED